MKKQIIKAQHQDTKEVITGSLREVYHKLSAVISPELFLVKLPDKEMYGEQFLNEYAEKYHEYLEN
jgi:hypothetical protein